MNAGEASEYPSRVRRRNRFARFYHALSPRKFTTSNLNRAWREAHPVDRGRAMQWMRHPTSAWYEWQPDWDDYARS